MRDREWEHGHLPNGPLPQRSLVDRAYLPQLLPVNLRNCVCWVFQPLSGNSGTSAVSPSSPVSTLAMASWYPSAIVGVPVHCRAICE